MKAALGLVLLLAAGGCGDHAVVPPLDRYELGGEFSLTAQAGEPFQLDALRGQVVALFFGYTYCPDFCPLTLSKLSRVNELLDDQLQVLFVSVDPDRDDTAQLRAYLSAFDLSVTGLTGTAEQIAQVTRQYGAGFRRQEEGETSYIIDHTSRTYLIDREGVVRYLFSSEDAAELMAAVIEQVP